jgi:uncharacterized phage-associated protein
MRNPSLAKRTATRPKRKPTHTRLLPAAVDSVFEIAFWFADKALNENEYLQPRKLQQLLYFSQAYYLVAHNGQKLFPAMFVADEVSPIEPSTDRAFANGRPAIEDEMFLPDGIEEFLDSVWRRFGHHSTEHLVKLSQRTAAYRVARKHGVRAEIPVEAIRASFARETDSPALDQVIRPKLMRSQDGRPVAVKAWNPPQSRSK